MILVLLTVILASLCLALKLDLREDLPSDSHDNAFRRLTVSLICNSIFLALTVIYFFKALLILRNQGTSSELKKLICKRHFVYLVLYLALSISDLTGFYFFLAKEKQVKTAYL